MSARTAPAVLDWSRLTDADEKALEAVVSRARAKRLILPGLNPLNLAMDLHQAVKRGGLRPAELAAADDFTFAHDVVGIQRHMDRESGEFTRCFVPRCARGRS